MAMKTSGQLSIKTAASTDGEINTNVSGVDSGSLVTLGQNSTAWTGGTAPPGGSANTSVAPYGMREYYGYQEYVPVSGSPVINVTNPNVFIRSIGGVDGQSMLSYGSNFYSDSTTWSSGTTPPSNFGYYSSKTSYYYGGGYQPSISAQWRIRVVFETYGGAHYMRLFIKDAMNSYIHRDQSNNTRATHAANSYNSNSYSTNNAFYAVFDTSTAVIPDSWYIVLNCSQTGTIWPLSFSTFLGNYSTGTGKSETRGWPTNYVSGNDSFTATSSGLSDYNMFFTNLSNNSISSGPTSWPLSSSSSNQSLEYTGPITIGHNTECSTSLNYATIKLGLFVRKSGYEDALVYSTYLGHRGYRIWGGGYCL